MTAPGKTIRVECSVVTGIRIDHASGRLTIEGVDQDKAGNTLAAHTLTYPAENELVPAVIVEAIEAITTFAQREVDRA